MAQYLATVPDPTATATFGARYVFGGLDQSGAVDPAAREPRALPEAVPAALHAGAPLDRRLPRDQGAGRARAPTTSRSTAWTWARWPATPSGRAYVDRSRRRGAGRPFRLADPRLQREVAARERRPALGVPARARPLYLVWTQRRQDQGHPGDFSFGRDTRDLFRAPVRRRPPGEDRVVAGPVSVTGGPPATLRGPAPGRLASIDVYRGFVMLLLLAEALRSCDVADGAPRLGLLGLLLPSPEPRAVGGRVAARPHPAVVLLPGRAWPSPFSVAVARRGGAVAAPPDRCTPSGARPCSSSSASGCARSAGRRRTSPSRTRSPRSASATCSSSCSRCGRVRDQWLALAADPRRLLGRLRALSRVRPPASTTPRSACPRTGRTTSAASPRTGTRTATWPGPSTCGS